MCSQISELVFFLLESGITIKGRLLSSTFLSSYSRRELSVVNFTAATTIAELRLLLREGGRRTRGRDGPLLWQAMMMRLMMGRWWLGVEGFGGVGWG